MAQFKIKKIFSAQDYSNALAKIEKPHDYLLFYTLWELGLRISEALNIRIEHINFNDRVINIYSLKKKGEAIRVLPISEDLSRLIKMQIQGKKSGEMFKIGRKQAYNLSKKYFGCNPHAIRHSRAINLITSGVNVETLRRLLGHTRLDVTQVYLDFDFESMRKELEKVRGLLVVNQESKI